MFNEEYYTRIKEEFDYSQAQELKPLEFSFINPHLMKLLRRKFSLHYNFDKFLSLTKDNKSIITTGIGLSGPPHVGTIYQIMNSIFLQKCGFKIQFVLGDLDSYNARNKTLEYVKNLGNQYKDFILKLGFNQKKGILRNQFDSFSTLRTMFLIGKYTDDNEVINSIEDTKDLYIKEGILQISLRVKLSIILMVGDFIDLNLTQGYSNIAITLGIDEHKYMRLTEKVANRMKLPLNFSSIYSWMIKGLYGYPKTSKSIPKSSISVGNTYEELKNKIVNGEPLVIKKPFYESPVYQTMCAISSYDSKDLDELYKICVGGGNEWKKKKIEYLDLELQPILEKWKS